MALVDSQIQKARDWIKYFRNECDASKEHAESSYEKFKTDPNYEAWVAGTEFGAGYEEKMIQLKGIADALEDEAAELDMKVTTFLNRQEEINKSGM